LPRLRIVLESGEARPFDRFERFAQFKNAEDTSLEQRLDEFALLRRKNLAELESVNLSDEDLSRRGRHPALDVVKPSHLNHSFASVIPRDVSPLS
jgi:hypothetical protein